MSPKEHAEQALVFLKRSEEEFAKNDIVQGSEKLWGAAKQAVLVIASQENGKEPHTHREMKKLVMKLAETHTLAQSGAAVCGGRGISRQLLSPVEG